MAQLLLTETARRATVIKRIAKSRSIHRRALTTPAHRCARTHFASLAGSVCVCVCVCFLRIDILLCLLFSLVHVRLVWMVAACFS